MIVWVMKGPGPELIERRTIARSVGDVVEPEGLNTHEEAEFIATHCPRPPLWVVTSAYHVPRTYLTIRAALRAQGFDPPLHVWGVGTVTNEQAQREALKLKAAQEKGHALRWEDLP